MATDSNPSQPGPLVEQMPVSPVLDHLLKFSLSLMAYAFSIVVAWLVMNVYAFEAMPLMEWVNLSSQPEAGKLALATMLVSYGWIGLSFLAVLEVNPLGFVRARINISTARKYALVLLPVSMSFSLLSTVYLMVIPPSCKPLSIVFTMDMGSEILRFPPQSEAAVSSKLGSVVVGIEPKPGQNIIPENLRCQWSAGGDSLDHIASPNSCAPTLYFQNKAAGSILLSVKVRNQNCPAVSLYTLIIQKE